MRSVLAVLCLLGTAPVAASTPGGEQEPVKRGSPRTGGSDSKSRRAARASDPARPDSNAPRPGASSSPAPSGAPRAAGTDAEKSSPAPSGAPRAAGTGAEKSSPAPSGAPRAAGTGAEKSSPAPSGAPRAAGTGAEKSGATTPGASRAPGARDAAKPVASPPADTGPRFAWPSLRVLEQVDASEVLDANGVPVVLRAVVVKDSAQDLVQRFADAFRAGGLHVPPGSEQPQLASGVAMLTGVDMYRGLTYTVILQPQEGGVTLVYLGEANHALAREPSAAGDVATLPPGAHGVMRVSDESSRTLSFQVPMSEAEVSTFYAQVLGRDGWRLADGETSIYTRPGEELRIIQAPAEKGMRSVVLVHRGRLRGP
ncbi:hypothetical protein ACN47A_35535 [Myxococcus fulvus]|uniref:hypothetical protein n=1 Tax=Myxococcus fulvus TaxID=33 RepID=UPI003B9C8895